jgi:hypothetical protein
VALLPTSGSSTSPATPSGTGGVYLQALGGDPLSVTVLVGESGTSSASAEPTSKLQQAGATPAADPSLQDPGQHGSGNGNSGIHGSAVMPPAAPAPASSQPSPAGWRVRPWVSEPRHISAILARTHNLGRFERIIDQHAMFLNAQHIMVALSILPGVADRSRKLLGNSSSSNSNSSTSSNTSPADSDIQSSNSSSSSSSRHSAASLEQQQQQHSSQPPPPPSQQPSPGPGTQVEPRDGVQVVYSSMEEELQARARRVRVLTLAGRLAQNFLRFLPQYGPRDLATAVWALARLRYQPSQRWASSVLQAAYRCMDRFEPRQLSLLLWGVASLRIEPGPAWLAAAQRCALQAAREGGLSPQGLSNSLWALASIGSMGRPALRVEDEDPGEELAQQQGYQQPLPKQHQQQQRRRRRGEGVQEEGAEDVDQLEAGGSPRHSGDQNEAEDSFRSSRAGSSSSSGNSNARSATAAAAAAAAAASAQQASASRHRGGGGGGQQQGMIERRWVEAFLEALTPRLPSFEPQHLAMTLTALAKLRHQPQASFMQRILPPLWESVRRVGPGGVANVLWSLARLGYRPHRRWLSLCLAEAEAQLPCMTAKEKAMTIWALALLKVRGLRPCTHLHSIACMHACTCACLLAMHCRLVAFLPLVAPPPPRRPCIFPHANPMRAGRAPRVLAVQV